MVSRSVGRRDSALVLFVGLALAAASLAMAPAPAAATAIVDYPIGAPAGTAVYALAPGQNGAMWFAESPEAEGSQYTVAEMDPGGRIVASAQLGTPGGTQSDTGINAELTPATDGGVWVLFDGLFHVSSTSTVESIALPGGLQPPVASGVGAGDDGNAWVLGCGHTYAGDTETESCNAVKVTNGGTVSSYPLPSLSGSYPTNAFAGYSAPPPFVMPVPDGVWFDNPLPDGSGGTVWHAAFVSYSGQVVQSNMPSDARLVAPATGDNVWWQEPADATTAPSVTVGQLNTSGNSTALVTHIQRSDDAFATSALYGGRNGDLLWAQNTPDSSNQAGFMGEITPQGETRYTVGEFATGIAPPTPYGATVWSGSCTFGVGMYEAPDGNLWVNSAGHPGRLSVLTPQGGFSTFLPVPNSADDTQIWAMAESTTGQLWMTVNDPGLWTDTSMGELAVADPDSPPPGEPPFPFGGTSAGGSAGAPGGSGSAGGSSRGRVSVPAVAKVSKRGVVRLSLSCRGGSGSACRGKLSLIATFRTRVSRRVRGREKTVTVTRTITLGSAAYALAAGKRTSINVRLSKTSVRLLALIPQHRLRVLAKDRFGGQKRSLGSITLVLPLHMTV